MCLIYIYDVMMLSDREVLCDDLRIILIILQVSKLGKMAYKIC